MGSAASGDIAVIAVKIRAAIGPRKIALMITSRNRLLCSAFSHSNLGPDFFKLHAAVAAFSCFGQLNKYRACFGCVKVTATRHSITMDQRSATVGAKLKC